MEHESTSTPESTPKSASDRQRSARPMPPSNYAVPAAELDADRWVLLQPATRLWTRAYRGLGLFFLALPAAWLIAGGLLDVTRAWWQWLAMVLAMLLALAGAALMWRAAARPRAIEAEVRRLRPATWRERRRIARLLRTGAAVNGPDRPAAAAITASMQPYQLLSALWITMTGLLVIMNIDSIATNGVLAWIAPGIYAVGVIPLTLAANHARTTSTAARQAGVAPQVSTTAN